MIGGGGHCKSVLDCLINMNHYSDIGIIERQLHASTQIMGMQVIGTDNNLPELFAAGWTYAFVTLGSIGNPVRRRFLYNKLQSIGFTIPSIIDPSAVVGREVNVGAGTFVGKRVVINSGTHIGECAIINTSAVIEHDCSIGDFVHIGPGATLCGGIAVGRNTHVGAASVVRQQITIGCDSLIGLGSVVVKDIPDHCEAFGNPCRVVKNL